MEYGKLRRLKHTTIACIARVVAMLLVIVLVTGGSGMTVLADEVGEAISESREDVSENSEEDSEVEESSIITSEEESSADDSMSDVSGEEPSENESSSNDFEEEMAGEDESDTGSSEEELYEEGTIASEELYGEGEANGLNIVESELELRICDEYQLTVEYPSGDDFQKESIYFASTDHTIVKAEEDGLLRAVGVGTTTIELGVWGVGVIDSVTVKVNPITETVKGDFGETVHWEIKTNGEMIISQDENVDYEYFDQYYYEEAPWYKYAPLIKSLYLDANCLFVEQDGAITSPFAIGLTMSDRYCEYGVEKISFGEHFTTEYFTTLQTFFISCEWVKEIDFTNFSIGSIDDLENMFWGCRSLESLDLSSFETESVTNMSYMFRDCFNLKNLNISSFDTSNVTDMSYMFYGCGKMEHFDLSNFSTQNVKRLDGMFKECENLKEIDLRHFNTQNLESCNSLFSWCFNLQKVDLSGWNTSKLKSAERMFESCSSIKSIDLSTWDLAEIEETMPYFCDYCHVLERIETPIHCNVDVLLPFDYYDEDLKWYRMDTLEEIEYFPKGLEQSVVLQRGYSPTVVNPTKIKMNKTAHKLECDQTYRLSTTVEPANATNKQVEWSSSDASVASVNANGLVTAHKVGTTTITAKSLANKSIKATCKITVAQMATDMNVRLEKSINESGEYVLVLGDAVTPIASFLNGDAWPEIIYSVSNDTAAIENGKLAGKKAGTGILTATGKNGENYGPSASLRYRVYEEKVSEITLNESKVILDAQSAKNDILLEARISNHETAYGKVEFSVSKPGIVRIEDHGDNTATIKLADGSTGSVVVTAKATDGSGKSASCTIISGTLVETITVSATLEMDIEKAYLLGVGKTAKLTAGVVPSNATVKTVEWTSSDVNVVTVDAKGGVTAVSPGVAIIYATAMDGSGVNGICAIRVTRPATAMSLTLEGGTGGKVALFSPEAGCEFRVIPTLTGADGATDGVLQDVNYTLSGTGAKNVLFLGGGRLRATAPGVVTVTATSKDGSKLKSSIKITIEQHVYAFDVQAPKNIGKYQETDGGEYWIAYKGSKDVTLTPVVTYNENSKTHPADKTYKNYEILFEEGTEDLFGIDKKGTGLVVTKNTPAGIYAVTFLNKDSNLSQKVYIDVVAAEEIYIRDVAITLPDSIASDGATKFIAEGSKVKLTGVLNGGEKIKGHTLEWSLEGREDNTGSAVVSAAGIVDLSKAVQGDIYTVSLTISKGEEARTSKPLEITVTKKAETSALQLVLAENEEEVLPASFNVQYVNNGRVFKVAEQSGCANRYSVTGGKKGVLTLEETEDGYIIRAEATGSAKITIAALDGSNVKKVFSVKVVSADNPVSKVTTTSKTYSIEPGRPILIPYSVSAKKGAVTDARVEWTSSNESLLKVSTGAVESCAVSCVTTEATGYLTLFSVSGMTGKAILTGKALDGSKKSVKVTINVVSEAKNEVTYRISLQTPAKTANGGVPGLALITHGKSVKLSANVFPNKAKNKTILYTIEGFNAGGVEATQEELKQMGITVKNGVVAASKNSTYTGYVRVTAMLDYMTFDSDELKSITASKILYIQPPVTKVEIVDADGKTIKTAQAGAGETLTLNKKVTGAGALTYANVGWSVSDSKLATVDANGRVTIKPDAKKGKKVKVTVTALDGSKKKAVVTIIIE